MADNIVRREVQRRDDPFGIPACFYWTIDEVADWIESIGYAKYKENFRSHFINGRKLLTVDACVLPKMGITHFGDILVLSKQIRDQLRIKKNVQSFNPAKLRYPYISLAHRSGKYHPHMTYKQHADMAEKIVQSRINYFRKKNLYYSGWSMEDWWDEKLKAVEKLRREFRKISQDEEEERKPTFGVTLQERLHAAAKMELSYEEPTPSWPQKLLRRTCSLPPTLETLSLENDMKTKVIGHLNWTPLIFKQPSLKTPRKAQAPAKCLKTMPYLPIIFHWKEMEMSKGYELSRTDKKHKCGYYQG